MATRRSRKTSWRDRPTSDLVVLFLAGVVGISVLITVVAVIVVAIWRPSVDEARVIQRIGSILTSLIGVIVGYMAGSANGRKPPDDLP